MRLVMQEEVTDLQARIRLSERDAGNSDVPARAGRPADEQAYPGSPGYFVGGGSQDGESYPQYPRNTAQQIGRGSPGSATPYEGLA